MTALDNYIDLVDPKLTFGLFAEDTIYIELSSKHDPHGKCVASMRIEWVHHFAEGSYAPRMELTADEIKFLAMHHEILDIFLKMDGSSISMKMVMDELSKIAHRKDLVSMSGEKHIDELFLIDEEKRYQDFIQSYPDSENATH